MYGQYVEKPGNAGDRIWQVGVAASGPPYSSTSFSRSTAKLTARRTRGSSNGARRTFKNIHKPPGLREVVQLPGRAGQELRGVAVPREIREPHQVRAAAIDRGRVRLELVRAA